MAATLAVLGAVLTGVLWHLGGAVLSGIRDLSLTVSELQRPLSRIADTPEAAFSLRLKDLEDAVERLPRKWEDIKRESASAESRARHHVRRAREELEERGFTDAGLEDMAQQLQLVDGSGSTPEGMQPVHQGMEGDAAAHENDWRAVANRRKFGG